MFAPVKVTRQTYRAHLVSWWAEKIPGTNFWKGKVAISEGQGKLKPNRLDGPEDRFETEQEALDDIFQAARNWIDHRLDRMR
jgi:hypothetical protein